MDHGQNHQNHAQQQQHHHQQHQQLPSHQLLPSQLVPSMHHQAQSQLQPVDATPQDRLAEARKNLQVLIDCGFSRDLLHQWVDENSHSPQLNLAQSLGPMILQSTQQQQQQQPQTQTQQQIQSQVQQQQQQQPQQVFTPTQPSPSPSHSHHHSPQSHTPPQMPQPAPHQQPSPQEPLGPPPPPPQCPPPPIPTMASNSSSAASTPAIDVGQPPHTIPEHSATPWSPTHAQGLVSNIAEADSNVFLPPTAPFAHRPRISVSSTSSGSSGHASIWSNSSAHTAMSWHSAGTGFKSHLSSPTTSPTGAPLINGAQAAATSKTNIYWCTSCETSFKRKYDWKRHEDEFHERWRKYPCPEPGCNRSFWGSNSFNQHHKQCHGCTTCPHAEKVVKFLRKRKYWACGFCSALHPARERHVEHVARHFESGLTKGDWMHSRVVYGLLHQPLIHEAWDALVDSKQADYMGRRPQFSWHPSKTGRAQGFLEKENNGQLQDLLEFFSGNEGEAQFIVNSAYNLADIVLTTGGPTPSPQFADAPLGSHAFSQDPRMSYASLSSQGSTPTPTQTPQPQQPQQQQQQHPQQQHLMMHQPDASSQHHFSTGFGAPMFVQTQPFAPPPPPRAGSDVSSHSPMTAQHSPNTVSPTPGIKRELPAPPQESGENLMDFEFSPAPINFDDWESFSGAMLDDSPQPTNQVSQSNWGMMPVFNDPRISS